ncbi:hypothetical protein ACFQ0K_06340 [Nocardioides caeni]|uniref:DUF4232 domain-containing protein n=1 Tax=Nocardioides caeni TaxID=574700 RepID=A0A4S8NDF2_9ACTN|nr:hypothetical protein [Nocardioides caeni]THV12944.1 hypothetical protein E9934_11240 [Nocardioides caeni]
MPSRPPTAMAPRGPLPAGVYWRRRLFVGVLALSIVFVIGRWIAGGDDGSSDDGAAAQQAAAQVQATETVTAGVDDGDVTPDASGSPSAEATPRLAQPEGPCTPDDVVVTPSVAEGQAAGADVTVQLSLQSLRSEACTWEVSGTSLVVRISQSGDQLWTTQQCRRAVPDQSVVVRRSVATVVPLTWDARESDQGCSGRTNWVMPGEFTIAAAALGGEPTVAEFALVSPSEDTTIDMKWEPARAFR